MAIYESVVTARGLRPKALASEFRRGVSLGVWHSPTFCEITDCLPFPGNMLLVSAYGIGTPDKNDTSTIGLGKIGICQAPFPEVLLVSDRLPRLLVKES